MLSAETIQRLGIRLNLALIVLSIGLLAALVLGVFILSANTHQ